MNIATLLYHEVSDLALVPHAILHSALDLLEIPSDTSTEVFTLAKARNSVQTSGGLTITPLYAFASAPAPDILILPGGRGALKASKDRAISRYLKDTVPQLKLKASISSGALILGELGFLRNQSVTSHPDLLEQLESYEVLHVSSERLVKNPQLWCAGASGAGIDLGLALVEHLFGTELRSKVATYLGLV